MRSIADLAHEAHAAVELHAGVHHLVDQFAAIGLHHRDLARAVDALRIEPGRVIDELPAGLDLRGEHREALADGLLVP